MITFDLMDQLKTIDLIKSKAINKSKTIDELLFCTSFFLVSFNAQFNDNSMSMIKLHFIKMNFFSSIFRAKLSAKKKSCFLWLYHHQKKSLGKLKFMQNIQWFIRKIEMKWPIIRINICLKHTKQKKNCLYSNRANFHTCLYTTKDSRMKMENKKKFPKKYCVKNGFANGKIKIFQ